MDTDLPIKSDTEQTSLDPSPVAKSPSRRARRRASSGGAGRSIVPGVFLILAFLSLAISVPLWLFVDSPDASLTLCACITIVSVWYVADNARLYGGLTFSSCFVAVSSFVFVTRGIYISLFHDFQNLSLMGQPGEHRLITDALAYVLFGTLAFMLGALLLERMTLQTKVKATAQPRVVLALTSPNLSVIFLGVQVAFVFLLLPYGAANNRASLSDVSSNAYVYLLPTLIHGFNLYFFAYLVSAWVRKQSGLRLLLAAGSLGLMLFHAYCLYNMSNFRGFYIVGLFTAGIVCILARWGKVHVLLLVVIFALYPLFKNMGSDRTLSNQEMVDAVILNPTNSYDGEGMQRAFGPNTDLNMLDTMVASLNSEHRWHPYVLSDLYVLVHWVPRKVWPGKPSSGILTDISYARGLPFSPGIIGFFNDDGGKLYMIVAMGFLGAIFKWCERMTFRIRGQELYLCIWAAFFLTALVTVRYLPYQAFYGFMVFFVPCLVVNWCVKALTGQSDAPRKRKGNSDVSQPVHVQRHQTIPGQR